MMQNRIEFVSTLVYPLQRLRTPSRSYVKKGDEGGLLVSLCQAHADLQKSNGHTYTALAWNLLNIMDLTGFFPG